MPLTASTMDIYAQNIMDNYKNPRHRGRLSSPDAEYRALNQSCGDDITVYIKFDGDTIRKISFTGQGCAISQAGISILSSELIGKTKKEALSYGFEDIKRIYGITISERRYNCAMLGLQAIQQAIMNTV